MAALLASRHLAAVGGFTPVVLHEPSHDPAPGIERLLDSYGAARAGVLMLSAATGQDGYDTRPDLDGPAGRPCSPTSTGSLAWPPRAASAPSCIRTSAP